MDEAVLVNVHGVTVTVQQPLHRGMMVMVVAAPHIRQKARKSSVSTERASRLPVHAASSI